MSSKSLINASVLEFKLPSDLGFGYCKILDFRYLREFDGVLVKVFDHITHAPIKDINVLGQKGLLFGARRMPSLPGIKGKGAWKLKGILISYDDETIPDFKYCINSSPFDDDDSVVGPWNAVRSINKLVECNYDGVKHLEDTILSPRPAIEVRTAMEYCRQNGFKIEDFFDLENGVNKIVYKQMIKVPIYKSISSEIRGKAFNC